MRGRDYERVEKVNGGQDIEVSQIGIFDSHRRNCNTRETEILPQGSPFFLAWRSPHFELGLGGCIQSTFFGPNSRVPLPHRDFIDINLI